MLDKYTVSPITEEDEVQGETEEVTGYTVTPFIEEGSESDPIDTRPSRDPLVTRHLRETQDLDKAMAITGNDLAYSLEVTKGLDSKTAKRVAEAAERSNLPRGTVERNLGQVERNLQDKEILSTLTQTKEDGTLRHPKTAQYLSDSKRMSLARDEVKRLAEIEQIIANEDREDNNVLEDIGSIAKRGSLQIASKITQIPGHLQDMSKQALLNFVAGTTTSPSLKSLAENYPIEPSKELLYNPVAMYLQEEAEKIEIEATKHNAIDQLSDGEILKGSYNIFLQSVESAPLMLSMMAATMAGVPPTVTLMTMGEIDGAPSAFRCR